MQSKEVPAEHVAQVLSQFGQVLSDVCIQYPSGQAIKHSLG